MLMAHRETLTGMVAEYGELSRTAAARRTPDVRRRLDDVAYTLCVSTSTHDVHAALPAARHQLRDAQCGGRSGSALWAAYRACGCHWRVPLSLAPLMVRA
ncbi:DUF5133 domain-containing protein [Streptomyces uncialis]|uniref:DUF5133 domain-containing protein n=1 Tax=Streptomyces uncialis TaxID=1048205 RepID=UPI0038247391